MSRATLTAAARTGVHRDQVRQHFEEYDAKFAADATVQEREEGYAGMVNRFYDLVTDFYEYGWGQSFHFAPRDLGESFEDSIKRYENTLAVRLGARPDDHLLDIGCGVGGPMRNIARLTGSRITGLNNNLYQIERGQEHNVNAALDHQLELVKGDFMQMPFEDEHFDGAYQIEATCHAPKPVGVYREVFRVLKPGASFAGYEWCVTDRYDPANPEHREVIHMVERGNGLPRLRTTHEIDEALEQAGFEQIFCEDAALTGDPNSPWYLALSGRERHPRSIPRTRVGRAITHRTVKTLERLRIAPEGSTQVSALLNEAADALVIAGELGIFTPMYRHVGRKPDAP